jgi:hypothetical protein
MSTDVARRVADANPVATPLPSAITPAQERLLAEIVAQPRRRRHAPRRAALAVACAGAALLVVAVIGVATRPDVEREAGVAALSPDAARWEGAPAPDGVQRSFDQLRHETSPPPEARPHAGPLRADLPPRVTVAEGVYATRTPAGEWCVVAVGRGHVTNMAWGGAAQIPRATEVRVVIRTGATIVGWVPNARAREVVLDRGGATRPVTAPVGSYGFFTATVPKPVRPGEPSRLEATALDASGNVVAKVR